MSVDGIDTLADSLQKQGVSSDDVIAAIYQSYANCMKDRKKNGNFFTGFSRKDYDKYREEDSLSSSQITRILGSWSDVVALIPKDIAQRKSFLNVRDSELILASICVEIARKEGISPYNVSISMFNRFRERYKEQGIFIPYWNAFAKSSPDGIMRWTELVKNSLDKKLSSVQGRGRAWLKEMQ